MYEIAPLLPRNTRIELFKLVYRNCNNSPSEVGRILGMNPRQVYSYLPDSKKSVRNYPNDLTTVTILRAALYLAPNPTKLLVNKTIAILTDLLKKMSS